MGPTLKILKIEIKIKNNTKQKGNGICPRERNCVRERFLFYFIFIFSRFSLRYTEIGPSEFVGTRRKVLYSTRATRENKKHGISQSFQLKIRKILCFGFSQIYGFLTVRISRSRRLN